MEIVLNNNIILSGKEDYAKIGNSRIGGKPDLPKQLNYPIFENGFYEFILQINLETDKIDNLPSKGLLSIFYGSLDKNEAIGYYFDTIENLEPKQIPTSAKFAGVTNFQEHISHKISIKRNEITPRIELPEYNDPQFTEEENEMHWRIDFLRGNSYLMQNGVEDRNEIFFKSINLDLIPYGIRINEDKTLLIQGQDGNKHYKTIKDLIECEKTTYYENRRFPHKASRNEWITQLKEFENNQFECIQKFNNYCCLLSLESLAETRMTWGDLHKLEFWGFKEEFKNGNFENIVSTMP